MRLRDGFLYYILFQISLLDQSVWLDCLSDQRTYIEYQIDEIAVVHKSVLAEYHQELLYSLILCMREFTMFM